MILNNLKKNTMNEERKSVRKIKEEKDLPGLQMKSMKTGKLMQILKEEQDLLGLQMKSIKKMKLLPRE